MKTNCHLYSFINQYDKTVVFSFLSKWSKITNALCRLQYSIHAENCSDNGKKAKDKTTVTITTSSEDNNKNYTVLGVEEDVGILETKRVPENSIDDVALVKTAVFKETMRTVSVCNTRL